MQLVDIYLSAMAQFMMLSFFIGCLKRAHTIQFDKTRRRSLYSKLWSKYLPVELPDRKKNCVHWNKLKIKYGEKNTFQH